MRHTRAGFWIVGLASLALASSVACERQGPAEPPAAQTGPVAPGATDEARTDTGITTAVQARYYTDNKLRGRQIEVMTDQGVVTLRGQVESDDARQRAVQIAQNVEGVSRVDDQIQVATATTGETPGAPASPVADPIAPATTRDADRVNPGWITTKIQAQYFINPGVSARTIDVTTTSDGVVTLRGEVDSASERQEAVRIATETEGVTRVDDQLRLAADAVPTPDVAEPDREPRDPAAREPDTREPDAREPDDREPDTRQPDAWLTAKVQSKYFLDDDVKGRDINVDTADGVVTLRGSVATEAERRQAVALARNTDGVRDVRDELTVSPAPAIDEVPGLPETRRTMPERASDGWITTKIQSQYFMDNQVRGARIDVDTRNGVVTLKGEVDSPEARQNAETIAKGTEGVKQVNNQLKVTGQAPR